MIGFLEVLSNSYILGTATVFFAVIIALFCANFIKHENEKQTLRTKHDTGDGVENDDTPETDSDGELSESLVGKLKSARLKVLESSLTEDQLEEEKRVEREQLAAIFELLKRQEAELNTKEIDESELSEQMGLYR